MRSRLSWLLLAAPFLSGNSLHGQSFLWDISLSGLGSGPSARPFGITAEPWSDRLFVAVAGDFYNPNDVVAILDPNTDSVVGTISVGLFPEDIAFVYDNLGTAMYGAVTNSTDGTVTIWDAQTDVVMATVQLPDPLSFGSCFPFGITASESGSHFYVSTVDGSGDVHAIDLQGAPSFVYDAGASFRTAGGLGSRLRHKNDQALIPVSLGDGFFTGAEGGIIGWSTGVIPTFWERWVRDGSGQFVYAAGQDLELLSDGRVLLGGTDFQNRIYVLDSSGVLDRTLRTTSVSGGAYGLAMRDDESLLAICDLASSELVLYDLWNYEEYSVTSMASVGQGYSLPNEAVFYAGKLYVTVQANEEVVVFDNLPTITPGGGYSGTLSVSNAAPALGGTTTATVTGAGVVALLLSDDDVPGNYSGVALDIGPQHQFVGSAAGTFAKTFSVPQNPALHARNFFLQGVTDATNSQQATAPRVVIVQ